MDLDEDYQIRENMVRRSVTNKKNDKDVILTDELVVKSALDTLAKLKVCYYGVRWNRPISPSYLWYLRY